MIFLLAIITFWFKFRYSSVVRVQLIICHHRFRQWLGTKEHLRCILIGILGHCKYFVLTGWPLADSAVILNQLFSNYHRQMSWAFPVKLPLGVWHKTSLMISQNCIRWWLGDGRQQANTWGYVDSDLCRHVPSLGHNEFKFSAVIYKIFQMIIKLENANVSQKPTHVIHCIMFLKSLRSENVYL